MQKKEQPQPGTTLSNQSKDNDYQTQSKSINPKIDLTFISPDEILEDANALLEKSTQLSEELKKRLIDLSVPIPDLEYLFQKDGTGCFPIGDIIVLKGKQKAGKSTLLACWITAFLIGEYLGFKTLKNWRIVIYIDTEQNPANTQKLVKKIHYLCGYPTKQNNERLIVINLRGDTPDDRMKFITEAVEKIKPDLLVIDGAKDLISNGDINDVKTSNDVVQSMMTLSKNHHLAIITILHENKKDTNLRGHIGTELINKCSECWQVSKSDLTFEVEQTDSRNKPAEGFSFTLNEMEIPVAMAYSPKVSVHERTATKSKETFAMCLPIGESLSYTALTIKYCEFYNCKESTAHTHISNSLKSGILKNEPDGKYKFNHPSNPV